MSVTVRENYDWFNNNIRELCREYDNRYLAIKDKAVVGVYDDFFSGYNDMIARGEEEGTFMIHLCTEDKSKNTMIVHNHVIVEDTRITA